LKEREREREKRERAHKRKLLTVTHATQLTLTPPPPLIFFHPHLTFLHASLESTGTVLITPKKTEGQK
jgi:hypothetical protein